MSTDKEAGGTLGAAASMPLRALDQFEVADGYPDIRGWEVLAKNGESVGRVEELLVDPDALRVNHVVVNTNGSRTMVPVESVELQADGRRVFITDSAAMREMPTSGNPRTDAIAAAIGVAPESVKPGSNEVASDGQQPIVDGAMRAEDVANNEIRVPVVGRESVAPAPRGPDSAGDGEDRPGPS